MVTYKFTKMASCQISTHNLKCFSLTASFAVPVETETIKAHSLTQQLYSVLTKSKQFLIHSQIVNEGSFISVFWFFLKKKLAMNSADGWCVPPAAEIWLRRRVQQPIHSILGEKFTHVSSITSPQVITSLGFWSRNQAVVKITFCFQFGIFCKSLGNNHSTKAKFHMPNVMQK